MTSEGIDENERRAVAEFGGIGATESAHDGAGRLATPGGESTAKRRVKLHVCGAQGDGGAHARAGGIAREFAGRGAADEGPGVTALIECREERLIVVLGGREDDHGVGVAALEARPDLGGQVLSGSRVAGRGRGGGDIGHGRPRHGGGGRCREFRASIDGGARTGPRGVPRRLP
jgi:hypothetical protein